MEKGQECFLDFLGVNFVFGGDPRSEDPYKQDEHYSTNLEGLSEIRLPEPGFFQSEQRRINARRKTAQAAIEPILIKCDDKGSFFIDQNIRKKARTYGNAEFKGYDNEEDSGDCQEIRVKHVIFRRDFQSETKVGDPPTYPKFHELFKNRELYLPYTDWHDMGEPLRIQYRESTLYTPVEGSPLTLKVE